MDAAPIVDVVVVLSLVVAVLAGWMQGLGRTVGGLAGAVLGTGIALVLVVPWVVDRFDEQQARLLAVVAVVMALVATGTALGSAVGGVVGNALDRARLGLADAAGGAVAGGVMTALAWVLAAALAPATGSAPLTDSMTSSRTIQELTRFAPASVQDGSIATRLLDRNQPWLAEVAGSPSVSPEIPDVDVDTAAVRSASRSVVRVSGEVPGCPGVMTGSGFVVAANRVMTNAHVVAGADSPVIRAPGELPRRGRVVHLDTKNDLAIVATDGLATPALRFADATKPGSEGVVVGYPGGGPLRLDPARLLAERPTVVTKDGRSTHRSVVTLAASIASGNSGGPVVSGDGEVVGVIFARATSVEDVAYAVPASVARPLAERSPRLTEAVSTSDFRPHCA